MFNYKFQNTKEKLLRNTPSLLTGVPDFINRTHGAVSEYIEMAVYRYHNKINNMHKIPKSFLGMVRDTLH